MTNLFKISFGLFVVGIVLIKVPTGILFGQVFSTVGMLFAIVGVIGVVSQAGFGHGKT